MSKTTVTIKVSPGKGKGGMIIAKRIAKVTKAESTSGKPIYQTRAQVAIRMTTRNGGQRR